MKVDYNLFPGRERKANHNFEEKEPIVSIITPYYNTNKYIDTTVNSVLNQTFPYFEWIIVDDGSTNQEDIDKLEKIKELDKRIKVYHKENEGPAAARDFGAEKISKSSQYILFLDSDDLINETYIECAYWTLETNKEAAWTYTDTINFGGQNFTWTKWYNPNKEMEENLLVMTAMIRKEAFFQVNGFEIREKNVYEDWCLWLKMIKLGMYPVRMNFYGFWYRKKAKEESELQQSNEDNKEKAMTYVKKITEGMNTDYKRGITHEIKRGIQYPKEEYNWEYIKDKNEGVIVPKKIKKKKTSILLIIPWMTMGGADKFNLDIIKRSNQEKYEFTIISTEPNPNDWRQEFEEYATVYDLTTFLDRKHWISFINYIIEKNQIDMIFNTNSTFGYSVLPYLKVKHPHIPIMDYVHMEEWYNRNGGFSRDSSRIASVIDKTYVCNNNSEKILVDYFKRKPEEVGTIYIGVDEQIYNPELFDKEEILKELKIDTKGKYVISYICRIAEQKRPFLLLRIIKELKKQREDCLFLIAGDGPLLEKMQKETKRFNLQDSVIFLGKVKETEKIYAISDMTINCSIKEGLALTAYESLAMGIPVVSCDVGGQKELINEEVGVIVPCLQEEEDIFDCNYKDEEIMPYVEGINKILKNLEKYKEKARPRVLNGFTIDNMVENMDKILEEITKHPNNEKIENAKNMKNNIDLTKEFITRYFIAAQLEYEWLARNFNRENVDIDWKLEKKENKMLYYENTLEYKIKHPFYVLLTKMHVYEPIKRILKRGE
jgi:glycosyltransferase involved in cell wall biosynthesis